MINSSLFLVNVRGTRFIFKQGDNIIWFPTIVQVGIESTIRERNSVVEEIIKVRFSRNSNIGRRTARKNIKIIENIERLGIP